MINNYNPLLMCDFYKATHAEQYPAGLTKIVSYYTPRLSRLPDTNKVTLFGLQAFIKEYLIGMFNECFFNRSEEYVVHEYERVLNNSLGRGTYSAEKIIKLHRLGYLPLSIRAVPEGTRTSIGVPQIEISNTHPDFVWLVNAIETLLSCTMWHTQVSAEVGYRYWQIVKKCWDASCDDFVDPHMLLGDFSMRGQQSAESAIKSSAAWCLSFYNTATVPAIMWLEDNYNCDSGKDEVAHGAVSTEHSVMCSNYAVDGDEITHIKRLLTEIYPEISFSMVSDSYDYWNLVTKILPRCKKEIMEHKGCLAIRGDSGDPVEVIAGKRFYPIDGALLEENDEDKIGDWFNDWAFDCGIEYSDIYYFQDANGKVYSADVDIDYSYECGYYTDTEYRYIDSLRVEWKEISPTAEIMGTVWALWQEFGGTLNSKGYKVLNPHVKAIYGDSITPQRCEEIYKRLMMQGFAISNVSLGVGSFSMMCLENIDSEGKISYSPYTRDTFGIAVKATYAEDKDGKPIMIYKQPKALSWKKSQKGCCIVAEDGESYTDEHTLEETANHKCKNLLIPVFANGQLIRQYTLDEVRRNMYPETTEDWCDERYYW